MSRKKSPGGKPRETVGPPKSAAESDPDVAARAIEDQKKIHAAPAEPDPTPETPEE